MDSLEKAFETQLINIQKKTGKTLPELFKILQESGLTKHLEMVKMMKSDFNLGHGDANMLVLNYKKSLKPDIKAEDVLTNSLNEIYSGSKKLLRPLHNSVMDRINELGEFSIAPKKSYLSLRRKKQFAMVGPGTKGRLEIGLNMKNIPATERLVELPAGGMCQYKVWLTEATEIDQELLDWLKIAYESAG